MENAIDLAADRGRVDPALPRGSARNKLTTSERMFLLGEATYLFLHSKLHQIYLVGDLATFVITPIGLGQFRMYRSESRPVGFVAWAYLTDEASRAYARNTRKLLPADFAAGDNLWFVEFVAPFGDARRIIADLRHNIFPTKYGRSARRVLGSKKIEVVDWYGAQYRPP